MTELNFILAVSALILHQPKEHRFAAWLVMASSVVGYYSLKSL